MKKSMALIRMSLGNVIPTVFLFVLYVTGITSTLGNYAEQTVCSLADVAHTNRVELAIRSSNVQWLREGMQIFAFTHLVGGKRWTKTTLKWAVMNDSNCMTRETFSQIMKEAFAKWAKVTPFTFVQVSHDQEADIRIKFQRRYDYTLSLTDRAADGAMIIVFSNRDWTENRLGGRNWTTLDGDHWHNIRLNALAEIGKALGLGVSDDPKSVIVPRYGGAEEPELDDDDVRGIQALYGGPPSSGQTSQPTSDPTGQHQVIRNNDVNSATKQ